MRLRERQPHKEISGLFRFQPKTTIERVYDSLSRRSVEGKTGC